MSDAQLFGINPGGFHLTSLLLHIGNVVLLYWFLAKATSDQLKSLLVTAIFAFHPMNVEAVAWIAERKGLLATNFGLLSMIAYLSFARSPSRVRMLLVVVLFVLSLLAKSMTVILPFLLLLLDYWPLKRISFEAGRMKWSVVGTRIMEKIPLLVIGSLFVGLTLMAEANVGATRPLAEFGIGERMVNSVVAISMYLQRLVIPAGYAAFYPAARPKAAVFIAMLALLVAIVLLAWRSKSTKPALTFGIAWFLVGVAPVLGFIKIGSHVIADRYAYFPGLGVFIGIVWALGDIVRLKLSHMIALTVAVYSILLRQSHNQLSSWENDLSLAKNGQNVTGKNAVVCFGFGIGYDAEANYTQSRRSFQEVLEHYFDYSGVHYNLARSYVIAGQPRRALLHLQYAKAEAMADPRYHSLIAQIRCCSESSSIRNGKEALDHARTACDLSLNSDSQHLDALAAAYAEMGEYDKAISVANAAMRIAHQEPIKKAIAERIALYSRGRPFRGNLLHDQIIKGSQHVQRYDSEGEEWKDLVASQKVNLAALTVRNGMYRTNPL